MLDREPTQTDTFLKRRWTIFEVHPQVWNWLGGPPTWLSALVQVIGVLIAVGLIAWMSLIFIKGTLLLGALATSGPDKEQSEAARHLATIGGTFLGGLLATGLVIWRTAIARHQAQIGDQQRKLSEQIHFTTLFTKAIEQLGATREEKFKDEGKDTVKTVPNIPVRVGAVYALGRIGRDSRSDNIPILNILSSYISENHQISIRSAEERALLRADVKAAFNVLCEINALYETDRTKREHFVNLTEIDLSNSEIFHSNILQFSFTKSKMAGFHIRSSTFSNCGFMTADTSDWSVTDSNFNYCRFGSAVMKRFGADTTNFIGCSFAGADLSESIMLSAKFTNCLFVRAQMEKIQINATFDNCEFEETRLFSPYTIGIDEYLKWKTPDMSNCRGLTQENINGFLSCKETTIPKGLYTPSAWPEAKIMDYNGQIKTLTS